MIERVEHTQPSTGAFRADVLAGLGLARKSVPSRWLYDDQGCELFERITQLHSYYPARTETAILRYYRTEIASFLGERAIVIEYGARAGLRAEVLLAALHQPVAYVPVDSANGFLGVAAHRIGQRFPRLVSLPVAADFAREFILPPELSSQGATVAFFPGSAIGSLDRAQSIGLMQRMHALVGIGGGALIGFDLVKDAETLLGAHGDVEGLTAAFNLNLLARINRELEGSFPVDRFMHEARWNAEDLAIETHLVSLDRCAVNVSMRRFKFDSGESICTESARKFTTAGIHDLAVKTGWRVEQAWMDRARRFAVIGLRAFNALPA